MSVICQGRYHYHQCDHERLLGDGAFTSLKPDAGWAYFRFRLLAGKTNNNGSMEFGAAARLTTESAPAVMRTFGIAGRRAGEIVEELQAAGLVRILPRTGVILIEGWCDEQVSHASTAVRQRMHRAAERIRDYMIARGMDNGTAKIQAARLCGMERVRQAIMGGASKRDVLALADAVLAGAALSDSSAASQPSESAKGAPAGLGAPPSQVQVSGHGAGCDMSHRSCVTCHPDLRPENKSDSSLNPPEPVPENPNAIGNAQARGAQGQGQRDGVAPSPGAPKRTKPEEGTAAGAKWDGRTKDDLRRYNPVEAACIVCREHGDLARNTFRKRYSEVVQAFGGLEVGEQVFRECVDELVVEMQSGAVKSPSAYLQAIIKRRIEAAAGSFGAP